MNNIDPVQSACASCKLIDAVVLEALATYWLRRVSRKLVEAHARAGVQLNIKPYEFAALSLIASNPGITSAQVSRALGMRRPNFVRVLRDLEIGRLVKRCAHADDGRAKGLIATPAGCEKIQGLGTVMYQVETAALSALSSEDLRSLLALLRKAVS